MNAITNKKYCLISTAILLFLISAHISFAATLQKVAIIPFKINAEKDLSFLRDGIYDMLSTRLAQAGEVEIISRQEVDQAVDAAGPQPLNEDRARTIGKTLQADYVLFGSLTVLRFAEHRTFLSLNRCCTKYLIPL